jgi:hypothetical protein
MDIRHAVGVKEGIPDELSDILAYWGSPHSNELELLRLNSASARSGMTWKFLTNVWCGSANISSKRRSWSSPSSSVTKLSRASWRNRSGWLRRVFRPDQLSDFVREYSRCSVACARKSGFINENK